VKVAFELLETVLRYIKTYAVERIIAVMSPVV